MYLLTNENVYNKHNSPCRLCSNGDFDHDFWTAHIYSVTLYRCMHRDQQFVGIKKINLHLYDYFNFLSQFSLTEH